VGRRLRRNGGGPTWITGSHDAEQDLLIWGVGNPKPDYDTSVRRGDNLYTNSVIALRASTGELAWHFQFTPGDERDWDSAQTPVLVDYAAEGRVQRRLLWANRNGFYYVIDRGDGKLLDSRPFVQQNWAEGLDPRGRPIPNKELKAARSGFVVYPGGTGGTNWWSPSYDPDLNLVFLPVLEEGMIFFPSAHTLPSTGGRSFYTAVRALDPATGKLVWEYRHETRSEDDNTAGLLSTRGGVVFGADHGSFFALDSHSGQLLWNVETGGLTYAAPITYSVGGEQFVSIIAGRNLMTFALPVAAARR